LNKYTNWRFCISWFFPVDIEVTNQNIDLISLFWLSCYPHGIFYLIIDKFIHEYYQVIKANINSWSNYNLLNLINLMLLSFYKEYSLHVIICCSSLLHFKRIASHWNHQATNVIKIKNKRNNTIISFKRL